MKNFNHLLLCTFLVILTSCAGPSDPFGAMDLSANSTASSDLLLGQGQGKQPKDKIHFALHQPDISVIPERIITHRSNELVITINDPVSIGDDYLFQIFFNGRKVQAQWINKADKSWSNDHRQLTIRFRPLRFLPKMDNYIIFEYKRMKDTASYFFDYQLADCQLQGNTPIKDFDVFAAQGQTIQTFQLIEQIATENDLNPALLAGLVAQESSFDPHAVSWARAIGLTQITDVAAAHVREKYPSWPSYPKIARMNSLEIKSLILLNKLHGGKEWRLNDRYSLIGGIEYLHYLQNYWKRAENQQILSNTFANTQIPLAQVLLASYNSGAYRVKKALESQQQNWINDSSLVEAKSYVNNINSYCYAFQNGTTSKKQKLAMNQ